MYWSRQNRVIARCEWCGHCNKDVSPYWCDAWKREPPIGIKDCDHYMPTYSPENKKKVTKPKPKKKPSQPKDEDKYDAMRRYLDMIYEDSTKSP